MSESVSCYTVISRDADLLRWCIANARERAGIEHEFLVVGWNATGEIKDACMKMGVHLVPLDLPLPPGAGAHPEQKTAWFIGCLYACWNAGMEHATTKWVARMGSDQFFSRNWLANLMTCAKRHGDRAIYDITTVESPVAKRSRHEIRDWGTTPAEFDDKGRQRFDSWANDLAHRFVSNPTVRGDLCDLWYNHPTRGRQRRSDGVTWVQTKALWDEFGPMNDRVVDGVSPDVAYRDRLQDAGVPSYLCLTATSMHLVRGESREVQQ
mgnify:FL=1